MKNVFKLIAAFTILAAFLTGCQKDDLSKLPDNSDVISTGFFRKPAVINGKEAIFKLEKKSLKGFYEDETANGTNVEQQTISDIAGNTYRVIKVVRPNGKYFWIMIDNYKYNAGTGCCIYDNNAANLTTYGRLYKYNTANSTAARNRIYMRLPRFINGVPGSTQTIYGRLPNYNDLKDLFETTSDPIYSYGVHPDDPWYDPNLLEYKLYFDAFIFGREFVGGDYTKAFHSLGGCLNTPPPPPYPYVEFGCINIEGLYWTSEPAADSDAHLPLIIRDEPQNWMATIGMGCIDEYGFSVRYVFEPNYLVR